MIGLKTHQKFLFKEFLKTSLLLLIIFVTFYLLIDFFEKIGEFFRYNASIYYFFYYTFWKMWVDAYQIFPFVEGLSGLISLLWLSKNNELLALLSLGFRRKEVVKEVVKCLLLFSLIIGGGLNFLFPRAAYLSLYTWNYKIMHKKKQYLIFNKQIFFVGKNYFLIAKPVEPKGEFLEDLKLVFLKKGKPRELLWAKQGIYVNNKWHLYKVIIQKRSNNFAPKLFSNYTADLPFKPKTLVIVEKPLNFLSFKELLERYRFLKRINRPYVEVVAEVFLKIMYLFIPFILGFLPMSVFIKEYAPKHGARAFLKSILYFFLLVVIVLLLETLFRKGIILAGILLGILIVINILVYLLFF